jgi:acyl-CoA reductase-like NAD-dependent aldehyde dehydrogenase
MASRLDDRHAPPDGVVGRAATLASGYVDTANGASAYGTAYAYTKSAKTMADVGRDLESGMVSINHHGLALPELPFGGVKDSGYGSEGGAEALEAYFNLKLVTQMT